MSHESSTPHEEGSAAPSEVKNLGKAGLSPTHGKFLYHLVRSNNGRPAAINDILRSAEEIQKREKDNYLSESVIRQTGPELQTLKWESEDHPYISSCRTERAEAGYTISRQNEGYITLPRTAKIAFELTQWKRFTPGFENQIPESDFIEDFSSRFTIDKEIVRSAGIDYLVEHQHLLRFAHMPTHIGLLPRIFCELEYVKRVATLFRIS
jgi:hypothetical protein